MMTISLLVGVCATILLSGTSSADSMSRSPKPDEDHLLVQTTYGMVLGEEKPARNPNRIYKSFRGIPFAKPPLGDLRFKPPQKLEPWSGVFEATKDGNTCLQKNYLFSQTPEVEGSEDCLFLNVYAPKLTTKEKLPVLIFIHYGGFFVGSGRSGLLGPEYLMDKNIILVTFNYRLGVFGFFSTLDDYAPGNNGYKDQVAAMRWVQENIEYFGGDKNLVTIAGQSAGAASVHHHILSPMSQGLFHHAISMSGTALNLWAKPFNAVQAQIFRAQASLVDCDPAGSTQAIVDCLRNVDAVTLLESADKFKYFSIEPIVTFTTVTETKTEANPEPFLTEDPVKIVESGNFAKVPWIIGNVANDGLLRAAPLIRQAETLRQLNEKFDAIGPQIMLISASVPENLVMDTWKNLTDFYIGGNSVSASNPSQIQGFINIYTDRSFIHGSYQTALLHSFKGHRPIYVYNFGYRGELSYGDVFAATNETVNFNWGASHCDELVFLFTSSDIFPPLPPSDLTMSKILIKLFTNFVKTGNPTPNVHDRAHHSAWDPMPNIEGKPMLNEKYEFLNITGPHDTVIGENPVAMKMQNGIYKERLAFLESLPLYENIPGIH